jgi:hypothetical protein
MRRTRGAKARLERCGSFLTLSSKRTGTAMAKASTVNHAYRAVAFRSALLHAHELRNEINFDQALDFWNQNGKIECLFLCKYSRLKEE